MKLTLNERAYPLIVHQSKEVDGEENIESKTQGL